MKSVFLDANIFLDVFSMRMPFYPYSAGILTLIERGRVKGYTSSLNFSNLFYIIRKQRSREAAVTHLRQLASLVGILAVDEEIVSSALYASFTDFEDAIQYYTAKKNGIRFLLTHNIKDYAHADRKIVQAFTAEDYLRIWKASED
jgi:predicted nucleic acid-binding protein